MFVTHAAESKRHVEQAKALAREGARRYRLPFGVQGKQTSYRRALQAHVLESPRILVVQDAMLLTPAEHIFGVKAGDCLCVQTILALAGDDLIANIDLLVEQHRPALLLVVVPSTGDPKAMRMAHKLIRRITRKSRQVAAAIRSRSLDIEGCVVNEDLRDVQFV